MIRVNLADNAKRRSFADKGEGGGRKSFNLLPLLHLAVLVAVGLGGYLWYANLSGQLDTLDGSIRLEEEKRTKLNAVIKQDQIFEARKKALVSRLNAVKKVRANQVSPVVSLDKIADAVTRTNMPERQPYIWLNRLEQNSTTFNMAGISTSVLGIADFIANLENTGYFKNITQFNAQDSAGNYNFTLSCEYAPPRDAGAAVKLAGAN